MVAAAWEAVADAAGVGDGTSLLDLGCGDGAFCAFAARRGAIVHGLDAEPDAIAEALEAVPGADFRLGLMESLPWADASFDVVTAFNARAVRPGSRAGPDRGLARAAPGRADRRLQMGPSSRQRVLRVPRRRSARAACARDQLPATDPVEDAIRATRLEVLADGRRPGSDRDGRTTRALADFAGACGDRRGSDRASGVRRRPRRQPPVPPADGTYRFENQLQVLGTGEAAMSVEIARGVGPARLDIAYERFGDRDLPPVLLVMGLGTQMLGWPDGFCEALAGTADARHPISTIATSASRLT